MFKYIRRSEGSEEFVQFIQESANKPLLQPVLQRHPDADLDETLFFAAIGEDLNNEQEAVREEAFWCLKPLFPEIDESLHVRVKSQESIIDHLFKLLVKERSFSLEIGTDPRPYVKTLIANWNKDGQKRENRLVSLDKPLVAGDKETALQVVIPTPIAVEEEVMAKLLVEQFFARLDFLTEKQIFVIKAQLANWLTSEIAAELGMTPNQVSKLKSKTRQEIKKHPEAHDFLFDLRNVVIVPYEEEQRLTFTRRMLAVFSGLLQAVGRLLAKFHTKKPHE